MGCYDGAEVCELVGSYLLKKVSNIVDKKSIGLYRDDGLTILQDLSGPQIERKRKDIIKMFKTAGLNISIQAGLRIVNFLDVQFNLNNGTYQPHTKPDNNPVYINKKSNHPPVVLKQLPKSIAKRISDISFDENIFCNSIPIYSEALKKSGFNDRLIYSTKTAGCDTPEKKKRKRKVIWFNPPFSLNVKTNVGKIFLKLVKRHFPKENPLHKIFNKNTLKFSYSCMGNIASFPKKSEFGCNCRSKTDCPLDNKCLIPKIVYQADVRNDTNDEKKFYLGVSETPFKERFRNHKKEFAHKKYRNSTELSKYIWQLKDANVTPIVT